MASSAQLEAELKALDEERQELLLRIQTTEQKKSELQEQADAVMEEKAPLVERRKVYELKLEAKVSAAKLPRGKKTAEAAAAAAHPSDPEPHAGGKGCSRPPGAKRKVDEIAPAAATTDGGGSSSTAPAAGMVVDGNIVVPTLEQALCASDDASLNWPTYMNADFRASALKHEWQAKSVEPGGQGMRIGVLVAHNAARPSSADGFVLWRETWGRRNAYDVALLGLGYAGDESKTALPKRLLAAMKSQLDTARLSVITTEISEKAKQSDFAQWTERFGFVGIRGSKILQLSPT